SLGKDIRFVTKQHSDDVQTASPFTYVDLVSEHASNERPVYLVGHSHGGWLVTRLAADLPAAVNVKRLETIDPISYLRCTRDTILNGIWRPNPECLRSPSDFDEAELTRIAARSVSWVNHYQDQCTYLHASEIAQADQNLDHHMAVHTPFGIN